MTNFKGLRVFVIATLGLASSFCAPLLFGQADSSSAGSSSGASASSGGDSSSSGAATSSSSSASSSGAAASGGATSSGDQTGTGVFSPLPFQLSIAVREGYDDNVNNISGSKQGSAFTNGEIDAAYDFGSPRTQMSLLASVGGTYYYEQVAVQEYDLDLHAGLKIKHRASARLTLSADLYGAYLTEPNFSYGAGVNRRSGNYFYTLDRFSVGYEWLPRFSTQTSYTLGVLNYDNSSLGVFEDRVENTFGNEFRFALRPTTTLVAEYRFELVSYLHDGDIISPAQFIFGIFKIAPAIRLRRDSTTHYVLVGVDHTFTPRLTGSLRAGGEFRDYEASDSKSGPYVETALNYATGKRSTFSWTNRYGIEEPDVPDVPTRRTYRTGLTWKQELMPRLVGNVGFYFDYDHNEGVSGVPSFDENSFNISISARYKVTHYLGVEAGYDHTEVTSDFSFREYDRNRFYGGLNFAF
jgi:hypothetical protein